MGVDRAFGKSVVVVADDDRSSCEKISRLLKAEGLTVVCVHGGQRAIDAVRAQEVDLVLLDVDMPGLGGIDACRVIKTITKDRFVPVVLLSAPEAMEARLHGARTGADDHMAKPIDETELVVRVDNMLRVKRAHDDVEYAKKEIRYESLHDQLRALPDHQYFHQCLQREFDEAQRHLDPLACCIVAVDDFRDLVDRRGSSAAARALEELSERLRLTIRTTDIVTHFRTAEFGLLLPNTRPARALALADQLIRDIALRSFDEAGTSFDLSVAIGVGLYPSGPIRSHTELLDAASIAVARARVAGPNRVCVVQQQGYIFRPTFSGAA